MSVHRHLYLDLEETLTTPFVGRFNWSWGVMNVGKVCAFIKQWQPTEVHLFSFAIRNQQDVRDFDEFVRPNLEQVFGVRFLTVPAIDTHILPACCAIKSLAPSRVDVQDFMDFWNKQEAFRLYCRYVYASTGALKLHSLPVEVALIDDIVLEETWNYPLLNLSGSIYNVTRLPDLP